MNTLIKQSQLGAYSVTEIDIVDEEKIAELENAKLVYSPEFIPFYLSDVRKYKLSNTEGIIYGFIRFYLSTNPNAQFYFTNEQLGLMLGVSPSTVSNSISKIVKLGIFRQILKVKANGGTFRLLTSYESSSEKLKSLALKKLRANNNKIKENKLNTFNKFPRQNFESGLSQRIKSYKRKETDDLLNGGSQFEKLRLQGIVR